MPARQDLQSICVLGSGPIVIGQAAEFDYSGVQAVKALRGCGYRVVLINSNPATIMTDPGLADATYIEPLTVSVVTKVLEKERPSALLPTVGGQTALNLAMELAAQGVLDRLGIELIGAKPDVIDRAENRQKFKEVMEEIGLDSARSHICHSLDDVKKVQDEFGLPLVIRPSFTLGGSGGGIAYTEEELTKIAAAGLDQSPTDEILIEESLLGWKEFELELMRDKNDNVVVVCSIENFDPMGVHTGDSITVAPAQTLTDREYQRMRNAGIAILRAIGVETGGSNVQFALNPRDGRLVVIEMNPRVSRSSALASKATGFPIAKVAAKLAVGFTLDEIVNDITQKTKAAFEPSIDYVVVKAPRFAFEKFRGATRTLTTQMKSVGEAMAIGRTFTEAFGKVLRSLELGAVGLHKTGVAKAGGKALGDDDTKESVLARIAIPTPDRPWLIAAAMRMGASDVEIFDACSIDPWFLAHLRRMVDVEDELQQRASLDNIDAEAFWRAKMLGTSDASIASLVDTSEEEVRTKRLALGVRPVMKRVDTCAGEFEAHTPYLYSTYERPSYRVKDGALVEVAPHCEAKPSDARKVVILGGGPIRIGQGVEFDTCCVQAAQTLSREGFESIMVNCNPETVSTDYDTSDRLYFEPLTHEEVQNILDVEAPKGVIVQFGGQTPLKLSQGLLDAGATILGTSPDAIDRAEDRGRSTDLVNKLDLRQPPGAVATSLEEAEAVAASLGFPIMIRPSYVLGGRAMELVHDIEGLRRYLATAAEASEDKPVLLDRFLDGAIEVDVDVVCDGKRAIVAGIMEHIEEAGVHSGDSACVLPPHTLSPAVVEEIAESACRLALELGVVGLMNAQFASQNGVVFVIEVNPRASRTVPFVSKAVGTPIANLATQAMIGQSLDDTAADFEPLMTGAARYYAVKEAVLPFLKFDGVDTILGPEMRSTGEAMGIDFDVDHAFAKAQIGAGTELPMSGRVFISLADVDKEAALEAAKAFVHQGFTLVATTGTAAFLRGHSLDVDTIRKVPEGSPHIQDAIAEGAIDLVINTTVGAASIADSYSIRREALVRGVPYYTTIAAANAVVRAIGALARDDIRVHSLQDYLRVQ